jgi:iron complex transport system ATP-binding protein
MVLVLWAMVLVLWAMVLVLWAIVLASSLCAWLGAIILEAMQPFLEFDGVHVARSGSTVLHEINLRVVAGEQIAILGPNGCGKSTLIKTMTCECYPLALPGTRVSIFGRERWDLTELKRRLGVVSAEIPGKPTLRVTGREAVLTGFFSSSTLWPNLTVTDAMRERAEVVLTLVGAEAIADKLVGEMSAGEQRRVMIGRALVGSGANAVSNAASGGFDCAANSQMMLLLDEPSNALDLAAQQELRTMLRWLAQQGTGILLITHHIADILPEMRRVILMRKGRIVADGAKEKLLTAPVLSDLFGAKVEVTQRDGFYHAW